MIVVTVARKPMPGSVGSNMSRTGTGALNIDACRVATKWHINEIAFQNYAPKKYASNTVTGWAENKAHTEPHPAGRWPANLIFQHQKGCLQVASLSPTTWVCVPDCPVLALDEQSGHLMGAHISGISDSGTAARYFKQVK